jgi:hypothetical protein
MTKVGIWSLWRENAAIDMKVDVCPSNGNKEYSFLLVPSTALQGCASRDEFCSISVSFH